MTLSFTLPLLNQRPTSTKDMIFTLLIIQRQMSLAELQRALYKQYGKSISFQSVRSAALELIEAKVLLRVGKVFMINREWVLDLIRFSNQLQQTHFASNSEQLSVGPNMMVYTVHSLLELDAVWGNIIRDNFLNHTDQPKIIAAETPHFYFVIANLAAESALTTEALKSGMQIYYLNYGGTPLDKWTVRQYHDLGVHCKMLPKPKNFPRELNIGAFGDLVIKAIHPPEISRKLDQFYKKYNRFEDAKLSELIELVSYKAEMQLTVIKDPQLAQSLREKIMRAF